MAKLPRRFNTPPLSSVRNRRHVPRIPKAESAAPVEPAGTLQSETSLTLDTEPEEFKYGIVFLVKYHEDGIYIDSSVDVSPILGMAYVGMLAAEKLTGKTDEGARTLASSISLLTLRARIDTSCSGPYLVKSDTPIDTEAVEKALRAMNPDRRKEFLKGAKL